MKKKKLNILEALAVPDVFVEYCYDEAGWIRVFRNRAEYDASNGYDKDGNTVPEKDYDDLDILYTADTAEEIVYDLLKAISEKKYGNNGTNIDYHG